MSDLGWLELHFDGMVGDDPGFAEIEWAIKEIKRLRERVDDLEDLARRIVERRAGDCFEFVVDDARRVLKIGGNNDEKL